MINRQVTLLSHPNGIPVKENFGMIETQAPTPGEGQFLVRNLYFSLEAAIRGWLDGRESYFPPIPLGGVVRGPTVGEIIQSNHPDYQVGDIVWGLNHWEEYSLVDENTILLKKLEVRPGVPRSYYIGALGGSGQTAYVGLHKIGNIQAGETVVVSAAAGATGSIAVQVAKMRGCKVIGIVGSADKARLVVDELGADGVVNYRETPDVAAAVRELCPEGVNIYYDNVGGTTLDGMLTCMTDFGRVIGCGMISDYNHQDKPTPIYNMWKLVEKQLTLRGFLLHHHIDAIPAAMDALHEWIGEGKVKVLENVTKGIENTGEAYSNMMKGATIGKNLVELTF
ncbi:MAG: NADP-dependent oxidoreductase [Anaerolineaceae bacterium]|nr:NADP-dependent oxidoreductase [Anaerolineaceae bacterium]